MNDQNDEKAPSWPKLLVKALLMVLLSFAMGLALFKTEHIMPRYCGIFPGPCSMEAPGKP